MNDPATAKQPLIRLREVSRLYGSAATLDTPPGGGPDGKVSGGPAIRALDRLTLDIAPHEFAAITGPSGCGKSTLLHLLGGLDTVSSGEIFVGDLALHTDRKSVV